jgi:hypothetical protein
LADLAWRHQANQVQMERFSLATWRRLCRAGLDVAPIIPENLAREIIALPVRVGITSRSLKNKNILMSFYTAEVAKNQPKA